MNSSSCVTSSNRSVRRYSFNTMLCTSWMSFFKSYVAICLCAIKRVSTPCIFFSLTPSPDCISAYHRVFLLHPSHSLYSSHILSSSLYPSLPFSIYLGFSLSISIPLSSLSIYLSLSLSRLTISRTHCNPTHTRLFRLYLDPHTVALHIWLVTLSRENSKDRLSLLLRRRTELPDVRTHRVHAALPRRRDAQHDGCATREGQRNMQG